MLFSVYAEGLFYLYTNSFFNPVNFPCLFIEGKCKYIQRAVKPHFCQIYTLHRKFTH